MDLLWYLLGGLAIAALVRWWQPRLSPAAAGGYLLLAGAFYGGALATSALQVPTDIPYNFRPWQQTLPAPSPPRNGLLYDVATQMVPFRTMVRERLLRGEAPLWTHEIGAGEPLLGNAQSSPFSLFHLMALPLPPLRAMTLAVAWQTLLALLLMHALLRALGASEAGAALAALGYAFSTYLVAWAYYPIGMAACWIPGVLLGLVALCRGERGALAGLVACGVGLALSGHPESLAHAALAAAATVGALLAVPATLSRRRFLSRLAGATLLAALLAAPVLLPFLQVVRESERFASVAAAGKFPGAPWSLSALRVLLDPLAYGSPRDDNWTGPSNFNELCTTWVGMVPLALAVAGALAAVAFASRRGGGAAPEEEPSPPRPRQALLLLAALVAGGAAFGAPPLIALFHVVPGLAIVPPGRLRLLAVLALAVAAGLAVETLAATRLGRWLTIACIAAAGVALVLLPPPPAVVWQRAWWIAALAGAAACTVTLLLPPARRWFPWAAVAATALDLVLLGVRYNPLVPASFDLAPPPVLRPLLAMPDRGTFRVIAMAGDLVPNLAAYYGLADPRVYDPMHPWATRAVYGPALRSGDGMVAVLDPLTIAVGERSRDASARPMLDYLAVRFMLVRPAGKLPLPWKRAWLETGGRMWENPAAMPLFSLPAHIERVPSQEEAIRRAAANADFRLLGFVERHGTGRGDGDVTGSASSTAQRGDVRVRDVASNGFTLDVASPTGGVVVSGVSMASGWRVAVGGRAVEPLRVNGAFVGFAVPPGRHRAVLDYRPAGWTWGLRLAAAGALIAGAVAVRDRRRRRTLPAP